MFVPTDLYFKYDLEIKIKPSVLIQWFMFTNERDVTILFIFYNKTSLI